jgi:molybdenum cofactor cytidylyltransferase
MGAVGAKHPGDNPKHPEDNSAVKVTWLPDVDGIILAAGLSSRAGTCKMTLDMGGKTMLGRCIEAMHGICARLIIVGGYRASDILPIVSGYSGAELVLNENYREGMFSSVRKGLEQVRADRFFLTPGDYPLISRETYEGLLNIDGDIVIPAFGGETGHPVLMKRSLADEILNAPGCGSLREFIDSRGFIRIEVQDEGILEDVDTILDYHRICRRFLETGAV